MKAKWWNPFVANLWAWLTLLLLGWIAANASAFYRFASLIDRYGAKGASATPKEVVREFGKTVAMNPETAVRLAHADRRPAGAVAVAESTKPVETYGTTLSPGLRIQEYLKNPDVDAKAEEFRRSLGPGLSPPVLASLVANAANDNTLPTDVAASQAAMEFFRENPVSSLEELRDAMARLAPLQGRARERQLILEIARSLLVPPAMQTDTNRRTLDDIEAAMKRGV
ncbi:MAG: hypothetical protein JST04_17965 [Bdellovibrionales bacterium]|nr:hypothetical protein [Bdellovibrionales bacterium]